MIKRFRRVNVQKHTRRTPSGGITNVRGHKRQIQNSQQQRQVRLNRHYDDDIPYGEKECTKCGSVLPVSDFSPRREFGPGHYQSWCKECVNEQKRQRWAEDEDYREERKEYRRQYYEDHQEERKEYNRQYYEDHQEERRAYDRQYYEDHRDEIREKQQQYYEDHQEERRAYDRQYYEDHKEEKREYKQQYRERKRREREEEEE